MKNLTERPTCAVEGCNNDALVLLAGDFVCGDCCVRYEKMKNKGLMEELEKARKMEEEIKDGSIK